MCPHGDTVIIRRPATEIDESPGAEITKASTVVPPERQSPHLQTTTGTSGGAFGARLTCTPRPQDPGLPVMRLDHHTFR